MLFVDNLAIVHAGGADYWASLSQIDECTGNGVDYSVFHR